jgi:hypothetical protein
VTDLAIELHTGDQRSPADAPIALRATYTNVGQTPLALTFWWNRRARVTDAQGRVVAPGPGPVLPCGVGEEWVVLEPGQKHERDEPLACTQPAGRAEAIGWTHALAPGTYRVTLVFESPPPHGFSQAAPHERAFRGRVESNEVTVVVEEPTKRAGLLARLLGRSRS